MKMSKWPVAITCTASAWWPFNWPIGSKVHLVPGYRALKSSEVLSESVKLIKQVVANPPSSLQVFIMTCKERFWQITISWNLVRDFDSIKYSSLLLEIFVVLGRRALVLSQCFCQGHFEGELIPNLSVLEMTCTHQWEDMLPICFSRIFYFCHATWSRFVGVLP